MITSQVNYFVFLACLQQTLESSKIQMLEKKKCQYLQMSTCSQEIKHRRNEKLHLLLHYDLMASLLLNSYTFLSFGCMGLGSHIPNGCFCNFGGATLLWFQSVFPNFSPNLLSSLSSTFVIIGYILGVSPPV